MGFKSHGVDLDDSKFHFKVDGDRKQSSRVSFHTWDLLDDSVVNRFCFQLSQGRIQYLHIGLDCASFSILRIRSQTTSRTKQNPWGHEKFSGEAAGNKFARNTVRIINVCTSLGIQWTIENPHSSRLWDLPPIQKLERRRCTEVAIIDQCEFSLKDPVSQLFYRKRTRIIGSVPGQFVVRENIRTNMWMIPSSLKGNA